MTTYVSKKERVFRDVYNKGDDLQPKKSEGRLKTIASCTDNRAWATDDEDRRQYILDLIKGPSKKGASIGKYVPIEVLIELLLANKNADIARLKKQIDELRRLLDMYEKLELTDEQKNQLDKMKKAMGQSARELQNMGRSDDASSSYRSGLTNVDELETLRDQGDQGADSVVSSAVARGAMDDDTEIPTNPEEEGEEEGEEGTADEDTDGTSEDAKPQKTRGVCQPRPRLPPPDIENLEECKQRLSVTITADTDYSQFDIDTLQQMLKERDLQVEENKTIALAAIQQLESLKKIMDEHNILKKKLRHSQLKINALESDKAQLAKSVAANRPPELAKLEDELSQLRSEGQLTAEQEADIIRKELDVLKQYCDKLSNIQEENGQLKREVAHLRGLLQDEAGSIQSQERVRDLERRLSNARDEVMSSEEVKSLRERSEILEEVIEERDDLKRRLERVGALEDKLRRLRQRADDADDLERQRDELIAELDELRKYRRQSDVQQRDIQSLKSERMDVCLERDSLKSQVSELGAVKQALCDCQRQCQELQAAVSERDALKLKLADGEKTAEELERLRFKSKEADVLRLERDQLELRVEEMAAVEIEMYRLVDENKQCRRDKDMLADTICGLKRIINDQEDEISRLVLNVDQISRAADEQQTGLECAVDCLRAELEHKTLLLETTEHQLFETERLRDDLIEIERQLNSTVEVLSKDLKDKENQIIQMQTHEENISSKHEQLLVQLDDISGQLELVQSDNKELSNRLQEVCPIDHVEKLFIAANDTINALIEQVQSKGDAPDSPVSNALSVANNQINRMKEEIRLLREQLKECECQHSFKLKKCQEMNEKLNKELQNLKISQKGKEDISQEKDILKKNSLEMQNKANARIQQLECENKELLEENKILKSMARGVESDLRSMNPTEGVVVMTEKLQEAIKDKQKLQAMIDEMRKQECCSCNCEELARIQERLHHEIIRKEEAEQQNIMLKQQLEKMAENYGKPTDAMLLLSSVSSQFTEENQQLKQENECLCAKLVNLQKEFQSAIGKPDLLSDTGAKISLVRSAGPYSTVPEGRGRSSLSSEERTISEEGVVDGASAAGAAIISHIDDSSLFAREESSHRSQQDAANVYVDSDASRLSEAMGGIARAGDATFVVTRIDDSGFSTGEESAHIADDSSSFVPPFESTRVGEDGSSIYAGPGSSREPEGASYRSPDGTYSVSGVAGVRQPDGSYSISGAEEEVSRAQDGSYSIIGGPESYRATGGTHSVSGSRATEDSFEVSPRSNVTDTVSRIDDSRSAAHAEPSSGEEPSQISDRGGATFVLDQDSGFVTRDEDTRETSAEPTRQTEVSSRKDDSSFAPSLKSARIPDTSRPAGMPFEDTSLDSRLVDGSMRSGSHIQEAMPKVADGTPSSAREGGMISGKSLQAPTKSGDVNCDELLREVEELRAKNEELRDDIESLKCENDCLRTNLERMETDEEFTDMKDTNELLQSQLRDLQDELDCLKNCPAVDRQSMIMDACEEELQKLKAEMLKLMDENNRLLSNGEGDMVNELKARLAALENEKKDVEDRLANCKKEQQELADRLEGNIRNSLLSDTEKDAELQKLRNKIAELEGCREQLEELKKKSTEDSSARIKELEDKLKQSEADRKDLDNRLADYKREFNETSEKLEKTIRKDSLQETEMESELIRLRAKVKELENANSSMEKQLDDFNSKNTELIKEKRRTSSALAEMDILNTQINSLKKDKDALQSEIDELKKKLAQLEGSANDSTLDLLKQIDDLKNQLASKTRSSQSDGDEIEALRSKLGAGDAENSRLLAQIESLQKQLVDRDNEILGLRAEIGQLREQLETKDNAELLKELANLRDKVAQYEKDVNELKLENDKLSSDMEAARLETAELKEKLQLEADEAERLKDDAKRLQTNMNDFEDGMGKLEAGARMLFGSDDMTEGAINELTNSLEAEQRKVSELEDELARLKAENAMLKLDMDNVKSENATLKELSGVDATCEDLLAAERKRCEERMADLQSEHAKNLSLLKEQYDNDLQFVRGRHSDGIERLQLLHEETLKDVSKEHEQLVDTMQKQYSDTAKELRASKVQLEQERRLSKELKERVNSMVVPEKEDKQALRKASSHLSRHTNTGAEIRPGAVCCPCCSIMAKKEKKRREARSIERRKPERDSKAQYEVDSFIPPFLEMEAHFRKSKKPAISAEIEYTYPEFSSEGTPLTKKTTLIVDIEPDVSDILNFSVRPAFGMKDQEIESPAMRNLNGILTKAITKGIQNLTYDELKEMYEKTNDITLHVHGKGLTNRGSDTANENYDRVSLLRRIATLEDDLVKRQSFARDKVGSLELVVRNEQNRLIDMRNSLSLEKRRNNDLLERISGQVKELAKLEVDGELVRRQSKYNEERVQQLARDVEEERTRAKRLEHELQNERTNVRDLKRQLDVERDRLRTMKTKADQTVEMLKLKLDTMDSSAARGSGQPEDASPDVVPQKPMSRASPNRPPPGTSGSTDPTFSTGLTLHGEKKKKNFIHQCKFKRCDELCKGIRHK